MRDRYDFSGSKPNPHAKRMKRQTESGVGAKPGENAGVPPAGGRDARARSVRHQDLSYPHAAGVQHDTPAVQFVSGHRYTNPTGSTRRARTS